jgi:hypothetical protein
VELASIDIATRGRDRLETTRNGCRAGAMLMPESARVSNDRNIPGLFSDGPLR